MNDNQLNKIKIHPQGSGLLTDKAKVEELQNKTPNAFREAQDVLTNTDKYINKKGWFSSEKSRIQNLQESIYNLYRAIQKDGFMSEKADEHGSAWITIEYLSHFSDAFPNWQEEYRALNKFIPKCF